MNELTIYITGLTIDKVYFDQKSDYEIGDATIGDLLESMNVIFEYYKNYLLENGIKFDAICTKLHNVKKWIG